MKKLSVVFGVVVAGIVFSFGMSLYTVIKEKKAKEEAAASSTPLPTPAIGQ